MFLPGIAVVVLGTAPILASGAQAGEATPAINAVTITDGLAPVVTIESRSPLPSPRVGVLDNPPRIYLDFFGTRTTTPGAVPTASGLIARIRVALHAPDPPVTRVVIDLLEPVSYRVDRRERGVGRVRVVLARSRADGPVLRVAPGRRSPAPDKAERDKVIALDALARLDRLRPVLSSIDSRADVPEDVLRSVMGEFDAIARTLSPGRWTDPDEPAVASHQTLANVCVLGANAARARLDAQQRGDASLAWNAASAAAGALILLERATSELRPTPTRQRPDPR